MLLFATLLMLVGGAASESVPATLGCQPREFTFRASRSGASGQRCWGVVTAMACWGRCDTGEIGDWRFPFKRPFHTVCLHDEREIRYSTLSECDGMNDYAAVEYGYYEALSCKCVSCDSSTTSCQEIPVYEDQEQDHPFMASLTNPDDFMRNTVK